MSTIQDVHWDEYAGAGFTCWPPGPTDSSGAISVGPRTDGAVEGDFPLDAPASFVTAHNPGGPVIDDATNARRHEALLDDVARHGWTWWPAVGGEPGGSHTEDGVLLLDTSIDDALALAARFDQDAIYVWSADGFELLACDGSRHDRFGWTAEVGVTRRSCP
ncbi:MAG TPA: DUF3293 domain-containing protein [Acidimicrobiia bacterium]|nr:DUF3293 domain-containing protein [Acidimicrobiia bacterium]